MATTFGTAISKEGLASRLTPAIGHIERNVRQARKAIQEGRHEAEDFVAEQALQIRRHPLMAGALAAGAGAITGMIVGFGAGWFARRRA